MTPRDLFNQARDALTAYRLRAGLSSLGIVIGIATIVTAFAIGEGARRAAFEEIGALGITNIFVRALPPESAAKDTTPPAPDLTLGDASAIRQSPGSWNAVAAVRATRTELVGDGRHLSGLIVGVTPAWRVIFDLQTSRGRWLLEDDVIRRRRVAIVGAKASRRLFGSADPVGRRVAAAGATYTIVGSLPDRARQGGQDAIATIDLNHALVVPLTAMDLSLGAGDSIDRVQEIAVQVAAADAVAAAARLIETLVKRRHPSTARFEIVVPYELLQARLRAQRTFDAVLISVGGLALLISGIGIMNVMLASVAERTHEIGVRRAFGARRREIVAQFALEAGMLCGTGGIVGVPLGCVLCAIVAWAAGWPVAISAVSVATSLLLACTVGLVFGIYPARLAARLDPAAALRKE